MLPYITELLMQLMLSLEIRTVLARALVILIKRTDAKIMHNIIKAPTDFGSVGNHSVDTNLTWLIERNT